MLEHHVEEMEQHGLRLQERLQAMGEGTSKTRVGTALLGLMFKGLIDQVRSDKPSKDARDGISWNRWRSSPTSCLSDSRPGRETTKLPRRRGNP
jgi:hypothetical protein